MGLMLHIQKSFILYIAAISLFTFGFAFFIFLGNSQWMIAVGIFLAIEVPGKDGSNEWLEAATDEQYDKLK